MKKVVYIVPGFSDKTRQSEYKKIAELFRKKGIKPILIDIDWKYKTMSDYISEFKSKFKPRKDTEFYFFGFSYGAMISFISAPELKPKVLILCSLSPYFKEDLKYIKGWWKRYIGKHRFEDLKNFEFTKIAKRTNSKVILLVGEKEPKQCHDRARKANKKIKDSRLLVIPEAKHAIKQKEYFEVIREVIATL